MLYSLTLSASAFIAAQYGSGPPTMTPPRVTRPPVEAPVAAQPAVVAVVPGRAVKDLPNTTIRYYDITGKNLKAINKSLQSQPKGPGHSTGWSVDAAFNKRTTNGQCKITGAQAKFTATVVLPRHVQEQTLAANVAADWRRYSATIEASHAAYLWFVNDRLRTVEQAILSSTCDTAQSVGAAAVERLRTQAAEFQRANSAAAAPSTAPSK